MEIDGAGQDQRFVIARRVNALAVDGNDALCKGQRAANPAGGTQDAAGEGARR